MLRIKSAAKPQKCKYHAKKVLYSKFAFLVHRIDEALIKTLEKSNDVYFVGKEGRPNLMRRGRERSA